MAKLVRYNDLTPQAKRQVDNRFPYWSISNLYRDRDHWNQAHAFYVKSDGTLDERYGYCQPEWMADWKN